MLYKFGGKQPTVGKDTYVSDLARVIGDVIIGANCYIGHGAILRGDYGRIEIGDGTAVEEGVIVHAPPGETNRIGRRVTIGNSISTLPGNTWMRAWNPCNRLSGCIEVFWLLFDRAPKQQPARNALNEA